jgi:membrane protease subunit HflK
MNKRSFQVFTQILDHVVAYFKWVVLFAAILIALSGLYRVEGNEVAVVLRFGRLTGLTPEARIKKPGLHIAFPFFIDEVRKIPAQTVLEKEIVTHFKTGMVSRSVEWNGYLLTGDSNIVLIRAKVKYQIRDAAQYALFCNDAEKMIDGVVSGELTRTVTHMDIDSALTSGREGLSSEIVKNAQSIFDDLRIGIQIASLELTDIVPPDETLYSFEEVRNAAVTKETNMQQAREYASTQLLSAEASASAAIQEAYFEQAGRLTKARTEMAEFHGLYDQYIRNPAIIEAGTFRQRVSGILTQAGAVFVVPVGGEPPRIFLP